MSKHQKQPEPKQCQVVVIQPADTTELTESPGGETVPAPTGGMELAEPKSRLVVRALQSVGMFVISCYDPKPMNPAKPTEDFDSPYPLVRVGEFFRHQWDEMMWTISKGGKIQAFGKLCFASIFVFVLAAMVFCVVGWGIVYILMPLEAASLTLQRMASQLTSIAMLAAGVAMLYAVCILVMNGIGVLAKNPFFTGIFTAVVMFALLIASLVWGTEWLKSQFPTSFGLMERLFDGIGWLCRKIFGK